MSLLRPSSPDDASMLLDRTVLLKGGEINDHRTSMLLGGRSGFVRETSLRTRVSFEAAIARLGGNAIFLRGKDVGLGVRESVADFARVLEPVRRCPGRPDVFALHGRGAGAPCHGPGDQRTVGRSPTRARRWPT